MVFYVGRSCALDRMHIDDSTTAYTATIPVSHHDDDRPIDDLQLIFLQPYLLDHILYIPSITQLYRPPSDRCCGLIE
jgi:hypothetical protein